MSVWDGRKFSEVSVNPLSSWAICSQNEARFQFNCCLYSLVFVATQLLFQTQGSWGLLEVWMTGSGDYGTILESSHKASMALLSESLGSLLKNCLAMDGRFYLPWKTHIVALQPQWWHLAVDSEWSVSVLARRGSHPPSHTARKQPPRKQGEVSASPSWPSSLQTMRNLVVLRHRILVLLPQQAKLVLEVFHHMIFPWVQTVLGELSDSLYNTFNESNECM